MERNFEELKGKVVKHFKGKLYLVIDIAYHSETQEEMVLYKALYGEFGIFVRPKEMFLSEVDRGKYPDCGQKYRFQLINEKDMEGIRKAIVE
ncbi:DUF1653 domain-containing protein [uncultured Clostridium sp.]|uniref:DUF1653 domain-containing protein n=1 Tax=uncultured Clostridium sp. TaxID=59620 RepID=UPI002638E59E|nr:DUF1653 domain-containing protein [uncultured Clostridium sp.]